MDNRHDNISDSLVDSIHDMFTDRRKDAQGLFDLYGFNKLDLTDLQKEEVLMSIESEIPRKAIYLMVRSKMDGHMMSVVRNAFEEENLSVKEIYSILLEPKFNNYLDMLEVYEQAVEIKQKEWEKEEGLDDMDTMF